MVASFSVVDGPLLVFVSGEDVGPVLSQQPTDLDVSLSSTVEETSLPIGILVVWVTA